MKLKKTWINFLIIGINLLILVAMTSCSKKIVAPIKTINYIYKNNSGVDMIMDIYNSSNVKFKSYHLKNGDSIETHTSRNEGPAMFYFESDIKKIGDSVVVRFSNNKCLFYLKNIPDDIFNVKKYDNYSKELLKKSKYTLYYTFTEADYKASVDCK